MTMKIMCSPIVIRRNASHSVERSLMSAELYAVVSSMGIVAFGCAANQLSAAAAVGSVGVGAGAESVFHPDQNPVPPSPSLFPPYPEPNESLSSFPERSAKPYCTRVSPSPARAPIFAACVVCRRYVRRKPTNWKEIETSMFQRKENTVPVARPSIGKSPDCIDSSDGGACTVVSQYGGTASACADA